MTGIHFLAGAVMGFFLFTTASGPALGPLSLLYSGYQGLSLHKAAMAWSYTSTSQYVSMAGCLIKQEMSL